jgi:hypothetical protein
MMMRRIWVDYARKRNGAKRGRDPVRLDIGDVIHGLGAGAGSDIPLQLASLDSE